MRGAAAVLAAALLALGPAAAAGGLAPWPTYHRDAARTGYDPAEPPLGRVAVAWRTALDGAVYAEPLVVDGRVVVATEGDSLYGLDPATGRVLWRAHLGAPMPGSALPCGDIDPSGITGTPVADPATGLVYAVAFVRPGRHLLAAVDARDGRLAWERPVDPPGQDPLVEQQRAALALDRGRVVVAFGGLFGDCGDYHGWLVSVPADGRGPLETFRVAAAREAGIWAPSGPAVGPHGDLYVATGNGSSTTAYDEGDSVLRLDPGLHLLGFFAPRDWAALNAGDLDLGTTGPALLGGGLLFQVGKTGVGYLLDAERLGGIGGQRYAAPVCRAAYGGTAWAPPRLFVPCLDGLIALQVGPGPRFRVLWRSPAFWAGPPVVAGGAVWTVDLSDGRLWAFDPATGRARYVGPRLPVEHFETPATAGGRLFLPAGDAVVAFRGV